MIRKTLIVMLLSIALPMTAQADYRTGNTWMTGTKGAVRQLHAKQQWFYGAETGYHRYSVGYTQCKGDLSRDFARDSNGRYHHLFCAAKLVGLPGWAVSFQYWQTGEASGDYRTSSVGFFRL
jgi:hypothetical protein